MTTLRAGRRPRVVAGFTLLELLVSMAILVLILVGVLQLFDANSRLARTQTHIADMQQASRVGQYQLVRNVRMAGRGPMPMNLEQDTTGTTGYAGHYLPTGIAVEVDDNVAADTHILPADNTSPLVAEGTDILTIRGVMNGSLYQLNPAGADLSLSGTPPTSGQVVIRGKSPTGVPQNLPALKEAIDAGRPDGLLLVSPVSDELYAVVEVNPGTSDTTTNYNASDIENSSITVGFTMTADDYYGNNVDEGYRSLSPLGTFPTDLQSVAFVGLLEEYRYYIRQEAFATDLKVGPVMRLSRAHVYPGTDQPYDGDAVNLRDDIADNIRDLQVALGVESSTDADEVVTESVPPDGADEWLYNAAADPDPTTATGRLTWNGTPTQPNKLYYVRVTTLARTDRPDPKYLSPAITNIEDHVYNEPAIPKNQADLNLRRFRRRLLTTVIDLRNVS
jgi:prepilin-type N-terminal cleavage/methylation domain-containing protein